MVHRIAKCRLALSSVLQQGYNRVSKPYYKTTPMTQSLKKPIQVAHSPDADDIFMYYAIALGWVTSESAPMRNIPLDIETLNVEALKGTYDVSAISFGLYPKIREEYALLRTAVSFGEGYGPRLIKKKGTNLRRNFKVALSGKNTSNALLFKIAYPEARISYYHFMEIEKAVLEGSVDAGVLIHESILNFDDSLECEREIWDIWQELSGGGLPLPLGGMAIRRSIPILDAILHEETLIKAVKIATSHKPILSKMLMERNLIRVTAEELEKYLNMYANESSSEMNELQIKALDKLFEIGYNHGVYDTPVRAENYLIPREYKSDRFN